jgi:hypothetical protein
MAGGLYSTGIYPRGLYPSGLYPAIETGTTSEIEIPYPLTVSFRDGLSGIELGQGDSRDVDVILQGAGIGADLTLSTDINFVMKNDLGTIRHSIPCQKGSTYKGVYVSPGHGGITIPITDTHTKTPDTYFGEFVVIWVDGQKTFPNAGYVEMIVKMSL